MNTMRGIKKKEIDKNIIKLSILLNMFFKTIF